MVPEKTTVVPSLSSDKSNVVSAGMVRSLIIRAVHDSVAAARAEYSVTVQEASIETVAEVPTVSDAAATLTAEVALADAVAAVTETDDGGAVEAEEDTFDSASI